MNLKDVLSGINYELIQGDINVKIKDICYDSRKVEEDSSFIALSGSSSDGHDYIESAIEKGAKVIFLEKEVKVSNNITIIKLKNARKDLSLLSINFFKNPAGELTTIALTGTKGKTTTSWMIKNILEKENRTAGVIGTMGVFYNDIHHDLVNTTPESYELQKYLREMVNHGIKYAIMEVSSQALKVGRVDKMIFDYGIFTNLTHDHIGENEHANMEEYIYCKSLLFKQCKIGIFNLDDKNYHEMVKESSCKIYTYGKNEKSDLIIKDIKLLRRDHFVGIDLFLSGLIKDDFKVNTPGDFSAYNATSAIMVTYLLGCSPISMKAAMSKVAVRGRVEIIPVSDGYSVIVDYAHNGVSLESILSTMRKYNPDRIVSLFGCGGNRSPERRFDMGEVSGKLSDFTIITEDNSRYEDVNNIMNDIEIGIKKTTGEYIKIPDRKMAIKYAIDNAKEGDIILILGKGHETYQETKGARTHFDDREEVLKLFNNN